jgi:hypothetical protein
MVVYMGDKSVYIYGPSGLERSVNQQVKEVSKVRFLILRCPDSSEESMPLNYLTTRK